MLARNEALYEWPLSNGDVIGIRKFVIDDVYHDHINQTGPILQIGSRESILDQDGGKWRHLFPDRQIIGIDVEDGDNVDFVFDITDKPAKLRKLTGHHQFNTIICAHVLEHVKNPFAAARNIEKLTTDGGTVIVTIPWVQGYHEFPDDYWRVSFSGLKILFPNLAPVTEYYSDARDEFGYQLTYNGDVEHSRRTCRIERNLFQLSLDQIPGQNMFDDFDGEKIHLSNLYMPAMSVNWIGKKVSH